MLDAALHYAGMGWHVFPLNPGQKTPAIKQWQLKATTKPDILRQWWKTWPDANIAILTGKKSGLFAVDIDPKNGGDESITALLDQYGGFPRTATQRTGTSGTHVLFQYASNEVKTRRGYPAKGIDICSDGGYIVAAPSIHPNGKPYQWIIPDTDLCESPEWLLKLLKAKLTQELGENDVIKEGMRNDQLFRLGCSLRSQKVNKRDCCIELHRINQYQCKPPLSDDEVNRIIDSVNNRIEQEKLPLFRYRNFLLSEIPNDPALRFVLHAVSFYMDKYGNNCYPTQEQIAKDTGYNIRTVNRKLKFAVQQGYIICRKHKTSDQKYPNNIYFLPQRFVEKPPTM